MVKLLQALFDVGPGLCRRQGGLRNFRGRKLCRAVFSQPTSKRAGYSFQPVSGFMLRNACNPPLATSEDQSGSVVVAPRRRFDVGPPFVGREPATRSTEELLAGGLARAPAGGSI